MPGKAQLLWLTKAHANANNVSASRGPGCYQISKNPENSKLVATPPAWHGGARANAQKKVIRKVIRAR
jgi:hypothetical protein